MTTGTTFPTAADDDQRLAAISEAARRLYDAEIAPHIARLAGVGAWIGAAYDRLSEAIADHPNPAGTAAVRRKSTMPDRARPPRPDYHVPAKPDQPPGHRHGKDAP